MCGQKRATARLGNMSESDCSLHPRSKACALCVIFCVMINVHPNYSSGISSSSSQESGHRLARSTTTDGEGDHGGSLDPHDPVSTPNDPHEHDPRTNPNDFLSGGNRVGANSDFLKEIFEKYGHDGVMSFEGFQKLIRSLHIGTMMPGYGEGEDPHLAGGNRKAQHHYEHHMSDYDDYEYHSIHHDQDGGVANNSGDKPSHSLNEGSEDPTKRDEKSVHGGHATAETNQQNSRENGTHYITESEDHNLERHRLKDSARPQSDGHVKDGSINPSRTPSVNTSKPTSPAFLASSGQPSFQPSETRFQDSDKDVKGQLPVGEDSSSFQTQENSRGAQSLTSNEHMLNNDSVASAGANKKASETDSHDFSAQSRFRTRRLSSLRLHRSPSLLDIHRSPQTPSAGGTKSKRHPLRHWHQRQNSNRNIYRQTDPEGPSKMSEGVLSGNDDPSDRSTLRREKRRAVDASSQVNSGYILYITRVLQKVEGRWNKHVNSSFSR